MNKEIKKLSWNKKYYYEDGAWWWVNGEWKDKEVDHLPSISCSVCAYSGEDDNGNPSGDPDYGIECIFRKEGINDRGHYRTQLYVCNKCQQLYIDYWRKGDGQGNYYDGWWDKLEDETDLKYVFGITG